MRILRDWHYRIVMGGLRGDAWVLGGKVYNHPVYEDGAEICTSTPVSLDRDTMTVKTWSGSVYGLENCMGNLEQQIGFIEEDIKRSC